MAIQSSSKKCAEFGKHLWGHPFSNIIFTDEEFKLQSETHQSDKIKVQIEKILREEKNAELNHSKDDEQLDAK